MVQGLTKALVNRLTLYRQKNKTLPERIMVYRDGVSEVNTPNPYCPFDCKFLMSIYLGPVPISVAEGTASDPRRIQESRHSR